MTPRIDSFWLEAFLVVAEELHFGRAAERLHVGQSPLSQTIKKLEKEIGAQLFDRSTRRVSLSAAGHAFVPEARALLHGLQLGVERAHAAAGEIHGTVRVSFSGSMNHDTLPRLVSAVAAKHPHIRMECTQRLLSGDAIRALENGHVDVAFTGLPIASPLIATLPLAEEAHYLLCSMDHPLARAGRSSCSFRDIAEESFICTPQHQGSTLRRVFDETAQANGVSPAVKYEVADSSMVMAFVAHGLGVALIPECLCAIKPPDTHAILLDDVPPLHSALAWRKDNQSEVLRAVLRCAGNQ
ncbi:LysR family transcriptional regulator [Corynebacterium uropygiale]|uniref:LysR family transcriptional regulator n=1 Tax=Corynebacterium uropygiale TaxID=1775911 RepID=A0A9X1QV03_9CORY|nr:LysR family transcriptional regulator [Corynebacterium uropygiale]MCF4007500.1 LysR family transcriptional regulator [Corynebacterium uropygiale]